MGEQTSLPKSYWVGKLWSLILKQVWDYHSSPFKKLKDLEEYHLRGAVPNGNGGITFKLGKGHPTYPTEVRDLSDKEYLTLNPNGTEPSGDLGELVRAIKLTLPSGDGVEKTYR